MKQRSDGRWAKKKKINGKEVFFYSSAKTERLAIKDIENQVINYMSQDFEEKHNFKNLGEKMLVQKEKTVSYNTLKGYKEIFAKLNVFYDKDIESITIAEVQNLLYEYNEKGFSKSIISKIKIVLGLIFKYAISEGINITDFSSVLIVPKNAKVNKRTPLTEEEIKIVTNNVDNEFGLYPYMLLYTGLRRGELLALKYEDIDFDNNIIKVNKSVEFIYNQPRLKLPKSAAGIRTVPLMDILKKHLLPKANNKGFIFGGDNLFTSEMIKKRWAKYCKETGLTATQHQFRHTFATILYRAGVDPKTSQLILGHADFQTTMNIYTHIAASMQNSALNKLNNLEI
ncbi:MAG: site-specific integrase [Ruminococcaceae bacterium]|nr:site-specific integrase [Oscillospiraceae bacterium]